MSPRDVGTQSDMGPPGFVSLRAPSVPRGHGDVPDLCPQGLLMSPRDMGTSWIRVPRGCGDTERHGDILGLCPQGLPVSTGDMGTPQICVPKGPLLSPRDVGTQSDMGPPGSVPPRAPDVPKGHGDISDPCPQGTWGHRATWGHHLGPVSPRAPDVPKGHGDIKDPCP